MSAGLREDIAREKSQIRTRLQTQRHDRPPQWISGTSLVIQEALLELAEFGPATHVAAYTALPHEVQTGNLVKRCLETRRRICVPASDDACASYRLAWINEATSWRQGPFGVREPANPEWIDVSDLHVIVVPCVAYDLQGRRLGHGSGIYDALLREYQGLRIGFAFSFQEVAVLPEAVHDQRLDMVINETGVQRW